MFLLLISDSGLITSILPVTSFVLPVLNPNSAIGNISLKVSFNNWSSELFRLFVNSFELLFNVSPKKITINEINIIRPLLDFEKKNLEFISNYVFNFFVKDPSNENIDFRRVKIRKIIDKFKKSGLEKDKLFLTLRNLKSSNNALRFYVEQNKRFNSFFDKKNKKLILSEIFFTQPHEVVLRSFSDSLKIIGGRYFSARAKKIDNILQMIRKNTLKKVTLADCIVKRVNQSVIITKEY